ncbi:MAG TPA: hypothetical protein V6D16_17595 [Candidatus Obscuribacterales bacterium]
MNAQKLFMATCVVTGLVSPGLPSMVAIAAPTTVKPIYEITLNERQVTNKWMPGKFVAMYTKAADQKFGGTRTALSRPYDVDMAKMFEVTNHLCITTRAAKNGINGFAWDYRIDSGRRPQGQFKISCSRARDVVKAYGEGNSEITDINSLARNITDQYAIGTLNIVGNKVSSWMSFTQGAVRPEPPQR